MVDPDFLSALGERLFVMYLGGRWIAPLSERLIPAPGLPAARLACAGRQDVARAGLVAEPIDAGALRRAYDGRAAALRGLRDFEGVADPVAEPEPWQIAGEGPLVLLSARDVPLARIAGLLLAGAPRGLLWKPAPGAAASAHVLMRALSPVAGRRLALVQGDHATGALAAGQGTTLWVSDAPPPPDLAISARIPATGPRRR
ncbi:MAG: hypothetical protein KDK12_02065 [Rhodobacteraceae bacterium]|nr:hypothetical protein [Paracoccaceae bacterium]